jgi:hypothetical protein
VNNVKINACVVVAIKFPTSVEAATEKKKLNKFHSPGVWFAEMVLINELLIPQFKCTDIN